MGKGSGGIDAVQIWAKPQPRGALAVLLLSMLPAGTPREVVRLDLRLERVTCPSACPTTTTQSSDGGVESDAAGARAAQPTAAGGQTTLFLSLSLSVGGCALQWPRFHHVRV